MKIYVVNGYPKSGKTSFEQMACEIIGDNAFMYSTVDKIKDLAFNIGWDGRKNAAGRRLISDLKQILNRYNNFTIVNLEDRIEELETYLKINGDKKELVLFVDSREPEEIATFVKKYGATTILVRRAVDLNSISNSSDANVENYKYDYVIDNSSTLEDLNFEAEKFCKIEGLS